MSDRAVWVAQGSRAGRCAPRALMFAGVAAISALVVAFVVTSGLACMTMSARVARAVIWAVLAGALTFLLCELFCFLSSEKPVVIPTGPTSILKKPSAGQPAWRVAGFPSQAAYDAAFAGFAKGGGTATTGMIGNLSQQAKQWSATGFPSQLSQEQQVAQEQYEAQLGREAAQLAAVRADGKARADAAASAALAAAAPARTLGASAAGTPYFSNPYLRGPAPPSAGYRDPFLATPNPALSVATGARTSTTGIGSYAGYPNLTPTTPAAATTQPCPSTCTIGGTTVHPTAPPAAAPKTGYVGFGTGIGTAGVKEAWQQAGYASEAAYLAGLGAMNRALGR